MERKKKVHVLYLPRKKYCLFSFYVCVCVYVHWYFAFMCVCVRSSGPMEVGVADSSELPCRCWVVCMSCWWSQPQNHLSSPC